MLLMVGKGNRGGICHAIHRYATETNKYMKNYNKDNKSSYIMYLDPNPISQKLPVNSFEWKKMSKSNKKFIKSYDENSNKRYILEADVKNLKRLHSLHNDLPFLPEKGKLKNVISMYAIFMRKTTMLHIYKL